MLLLLQSSDLQVKQSLEASADLKQLLKRKQTESIEREREREEKATWEINLKLFYLYITNEYCLKLVRFK